MRRFIPIALLSVAIAATSASASREDITTAIDDRLAIADRAHGMIETKSATREAELRERVRAAYKLFRAGWTPMWVDETERVAMVRRRAAARHILRRDVSELAILEEELSDTASAQERLRRERLEAEAVATPEPRSLARPVPGRARGHFGTYEHDGTGAELSRRGVEMVTRVGREVRAVADGTVRFAGHVEGLGQTVIIDHDGLVSVMARLRPLEIAAGARVTRGQVVGNAEGRRIYLEIRLPIGPGGHPIDPTPLLERR